MNITSQNLSLNAGILLFLAPFYTDATKIARVSLASLLNEAQQVALVTVTLGTVSENITTCGIQYRASVQNFIKNTKNNESITFISRFIKHSEIQVGQQYIVFLNTLSENSGCADNTLEIAHAGYGAMRVDSPYAIDLNYAVRIPLSFVKLPNAMNPIKGTSSNLQVYESGWVDKQKFIQILTTPTRQ
ncbi:hypothetical protein MNBD_GAMMA10-795 [hydrothermal vent metagenome]|uniref:Uncharacterized protein n=1 Tax=hydrothermal vent metagenome TaxID=652676 RepID=A0A3B0Y8S1_9ZZZZ